MYNQHEWRLCFNIGAQTLVDCLNDIQIKLYVLLKLVLAEMIEPLVDELTSFMMKNVVFWLAERNPQSLFTPVSLIQWLFKTILESTKEIEMKLGLYIDDNQRKGIVHVP